MSIDGAPIAHVDLRRGGYLVLTQGADEVASLEASAATQRALGTRSEILDRTALESRFPAIRIDDVDAALHSPDDGWIDPNGALQGFRKMARHLGVAYVEDRVVDIHVSGRRARSVGLASGERLEADVVVNCANCHAPEVCAMVAMPVDIVPMRRLTFYFDVQSALAPLPLIRDHNGISRAPRRRGLHLRGVQSRRAARIQLGGRSCVVRRRRLAAHRASRSGVRNTQGRAKLVVSLRHPSPGLESDRRPVDWRGGELLHRGRILGTRAPARTGGRTRHRRVAPARAVRVA